LTTDFNGFVADRGEMGEENEFDLWVTFEALDWHWSHFWKV